MARKNYRTSLSHEELDGMMDESIRNDAIWYYYNKYRTRTAFNPYHTRNGGIRKAIDKHTAFLKPRKIINQNKWSSDENVRHIIFMNNTLSIEVWFDDPEGDTAFEILIDYPEDDEIGEDSEFKTFQEWFDWKLNDDYEGIHDLNGSTIFEHLDINPDDLEDLDIAVIEADRDEVMRMHKLELLVSDAHFDDKLRDEWREMKSEKTELRA